MTAHHRQDAHAGIGRPVRIGAHRFQVAFDRAPIGLALVDATPGTGTVLMANAALAQMTGIATDELLSRRIGDLVDLPDGLPPSSDDDTVTVAEGHLGRADGARLWVSVSSTTVHDATGRPEYLVMHLVDITERKRAEEEARVRAERDSRIATVLQAGLLPYVPRQVGPVHAASRYRPAGTGVTVGGDWSDVLSLPDGKIGMVVGDVAGHGIESAVTMTRLRTIVRMLATSGVSPAGVMRRLNDVMHETDMGTDIDLATLVYAQLDPMTRSFRYCSAGHLPLLVLTDERDETRWSVAPVPAVGGPPIGVIPGLRYTEQEIVLDPGSTLIGFTDGLIERRGDDLDLSLLRLLDGIAMLPSAITRDVETLADAVLDLSPAGEAEDDIAVIVLGFEPLVRCCPIPAVVDLGDHLVGASVYGPAGRGIPGVTSGTPRPPRIADPADLSRPPSRWA